MAPAFDSVRAINPCRQNWKIKVRVVRLWTMPGCYSHEEISSLEMILRDEDGDNIHATVKTAFLRRHRKNFEEGKIYLVSYFYVSPNTGSYRTTDHPYRANFIFSTSVRPYADDGKINNFGFAFRSFSEILSNQFDDRYLIDVIGLLTGVGEKEECNVNGRTQFRLDVELMDEGKEKLECTLSGDFTNEVLQHVSRVHTGSTIIIIQLCKVREFKGKRKVSNSMYSSRLLIHPTIQEVQEFVQKLKGAGIQLGQIPARIAPQIVVSVADDLLALDDRRKIVDLRSGPAECIVVTMANIVDVRSDRGWMYTSCKQCSKKVVPDGEGFFCEKCQAIVKAVIPRFMVDCEILDDTGSCHVVIFDRELSKLLGCSAAELKARQTNQISWKRYLFKIRIPGDYVNGNSNVCVATRLTNDKAIMQSFLNTSYEDIASEGCTSVGLTEEKNTEQCLIESSDGASSSANQTVHANFSELSKFDSTSTHQVANTIDPGFEAMKSIVESKVAIVNTANVEKANPFGDLPSTDCQVEVESSKHNAGFMEIPSTTSGHNGAKNGTENMLNHPLGGNLEANENNTSFARRRRAKRKQIQEE
ncbi:replication protein A 70 kDa DNA-binding subunit A-like [Neltuma alba]|uniref:replication protein A 70 kDa DNA-binding subunit A-like n=1 Tax=Neltuma alba TaxID=207710 RepID=UPI0010A495DF|nr:replication protein A 70 kDa DNA-binding subunit A-like [Prosopis alba]